MTTTTRREAPEIAFANELRKWWSFDGYQCPTHSWHSREDFIEKQLPSLLVDLLPASVGGDVADGRELHAAAINVMNWWDAWLSKQRHDPVLEEAEWKEFLALRSAITRYSEGITVPRAPTPPGEKS